MNALDPIALRFASDEQILKECRWEAFRASGPGGQKRNKTSSAIRLVHVPSGLAAIANESRSQAANRKVALRRLRHRKMVELRAVIEPETFVPPEWFTHLCPKGRLEVPERGEFYLAAAGLVLDVLASRAWSVSEAAVMLGLSTGNLVRFLQRDEKVMAQVNAMRVRGGFKPLG